MPYKVFFVEDEIITREGIRDNVDWHASGFEFCGEAADGEMALPLLSMIKPDVLITDIKMPFMDGLQLSKIVRERMPWVKIVILSGHDEFDYAREAIHLGVTDYLLKPVTVQKLQNTLQNLSIQLDEERKVQEKQRKLAEQVSENQSMLRERLLFKMIVGAVSPTEAIEKGQMLGLDLSARYYQVVILKIELGDRTEQYDYDEYRKFQNVVAGFSEKDPDTFALKRDWGDMILLIKGSTLEFMEEQRDLLLEEIRREVAKTRYQLTIGIGTSRSHIADLNQSFVEALERVQNPASAGKSTSPAFDGAELPKVDKLAVENFLRFGMKDDFDEFFDANLRTLGEKALKSSLVKNYILMDVVLAVSNTVNDLGGDVDKVLPELASIETVMSNIKTMEQLRGQVELDLQQEVDQALDVVLGVLVQAEQDGPLDADAVVVVAPDALADVVRGVEDRLVDVPGAGLGGQIEHLRVVLDGVAAPLLLQRDHLAEEVQLPLRVLGQGVVHDEEPVVVDGGHFRHGARDGARTRRRPAGIRANGQRIANGGRGAPGHIERGNVDAIDAQVRLVASVDAHEVMRQAAACGGVRKFNDRPTRVVVYKKTKYPRVGVAAKPRHRGRSRFGRDMHTQRGVDIEDNFERAILIA